MQKGRYTVFCKNIRGHFPKDSLLTCAASHRTTFKSAATLECHTANIGHGTQSFS